jgi:hypothetical protein
MNSWRRLATSLDFVTGSVRYSSKEVD